MHAQARECVSTRIWWVVGGLNCGLNFHLISFEPHPLGKVYNPGVGGLLLLRLRLDAAAQSW